MKSIVKIAAFLMFFASSFSMYGQEEKESVFSYDVEVDVVSSNVWRGEYLSGVSIQPGLSVSAFGLTLGAWGSTDFFGTYKELDFFISYEIGGFSVTLTDYWWEGEHEPYFNKLKRDNRYLEAGIGYTFSGKFPLSLGINTMISGDGDKDADNKQLFSTYITASYPFTVGNIDLEAGIGISPWEGMFSSKFDVAAINLKASKNLQISPNLSIPLSVDLILAPARDNAFFVLGLRF